MAGHVVLKTGLNDKEQHAIFQIEERGTPLAHVTLELPEFTDVLRGLGDLRTRFAEQVPPAIDIGARVAVTVDPAWTVMTDVPELPEGMVLLHVRHPGFGWLSFALPGHEAESMAKALSVSTPR